MLRETQQSISQWADATFGPVGSHARVVARANEEMAELLRAVTTDERHPKAGEEMADIIIVLCRLATRLGYDLDEEIQRKMQVNRARVWRQDGSGHGYHVREKGADALPRQNGAMYDTTPRAPSMVAEALAPPTATPGSSTTPAPTTEAPSGLAGATAYIECEDKSCSHMGSWHDEHGHCTYPGCDTKHVYTPRQAQEVTGG